MKKILFLSTIGVLVLASCKKDYTCDCTIGAQVSSSILLDFKKSDAEKECDRLDAEAEILEGSCTLN